MCKNCKSSDLGIARQAELDAAIAACQELNIKPQINGFLVRHAYQGSIPRSERGVLHYTAEEHQALTRYNAAQDAIKKLHEDYVWDQGRQGALLQRWHQTIGPDKYVPYNDARAMLGIAWEQWQAIRYSFDNLIASGKLEPHPQNEQYGVGDKLYRLAERSN